MASLNAATPAPSTSLTAVLTVLALCSLLPSLSISIANVALPTLAHTLGASFQQVQWVVLAYLLATTTLIVSVGRLGDLLGRRRLLLAGIGLFTGASVLCGLATGLGSLVAARAMQGLGAAVMLALGLALVGELVPKPRTGQAMGLLGATSAVGTALGPTLGGVLINTLGWPALFWINLPLGLAAGTLAWRHVPKDPPTAPAAASRFDSLGTVLLALTLAAYALAMTLARGHARLINLALLALAAMSLWLFVVWQRRAASPLLRLEVLRNPVLGASLAASALVSTVMMATLVVGPFYLAHALGLSAAEVGLAMSIGPGVAALAGVPAGRLVDRFGPARMATWGLIGMGVGCAALCGVPSLLPQAMPSVGAVAGYALPLAVLTSHYALFQAANNTGVMTGTTAEVGPAQRGVISGLLTLSRNLGLITGASLMGAVFAVASGHSDLGNAPAADLVDGLQATFAAALGLLAFSGWLTSRARASGPAANGSAST